jgi:hypothetical protein
MAHTATYSVDARGVLFPGAKWLGYETNFFKIFQVSSVARPASCLIRVGIYFPRDKAARL